MKTVFKYPITLESRDHKFSAILPHGFKFLRAQLQNGQPFMWLEVDKDANKVEYQFGIWGTGQDIPNNAVFQGTFDYGPLVFHLYLL